MASGQVSTGEPGSRNWFVTISEQDRTRSPHQSHTSCVQAGARELGMNVFKTSRVVLIKEDVLKGSNPIAL